jgi:hypothetical protein
MLRLRLPPHTPGAGKEADSGRGRMALQAARTPSAGARRSSPLVVLPQLRAAPSAAGALVVHRRLPAPGSRVAAWLQWQGFETPTGRMEERQRQRLHRRSRLRWRVGCCRLWPARRRRR